MGTGGEKRTTRNRLSLEHQQTKPFAIRNGVRTVQVVIKHPIRESQPLGDLRPAQTNPITDRFQLPMRRRDESPRIRTRRFRFHG